MSEQYIAFMNVEPNTDTLTYCVMRLRKEQKPDRAIMNQIMRNINGQGLFNWTIYIDGDDVTFKVDTKTGKVTKVNEE